MMKKINLQITLLIVCLILLASCKKENPPFANMKLKSTAYLLEEITFTSLCENASDVKWDFGDGHDATGVTVKHKYMFSDLFTVKISATNDVGSDTYSQAIFIKNCEAEYNVCNNRTDDILFFAFALNSNGGLEEYQDVGFVKAIGESDFFPTRMDYIYLGGSTPDYDFVCKNPYSIKDFQQNKLIIDNSTTITILKEKIFIKGKIVNKVLLEETIKNIE